MKHTDIISDDAISVIDNEVPYQPASLDIWDQKYRLKQRDGSAIDKDIQATFARVARVLADQEKNKELREHWYEQFLWALKNGAIPAGRIVSNVGAGKFRPNTSTINCTVSGAIHDSMDDILQKLHEAGLSLKAGCGIGYEFSTLRPKGDYVAGAGAYTSGPLSFMDVYDKMCFTISSAGGRRGAQMATFDISHPDVLELIHAKRQHGRLRQFNLSLLITEEFMQVLANDGIWKLVFPVLDSELESEDIDLQSSENIVWKDWPNADGYILNEDGKVACRVHKTIPARQLWDAIMSSTYDYAEPGFILIDRVNEFNNNWFCENIRATNPCGEQPLPEYGACLLGSINLTQFVVDPFADDAHFDWDKFRTVVRIFTRMLDNVVDINGLPLAQQKDEILRKRRHGMGFLGLGSSLAMLRMKYGEQASIEFTETVSRELALTGWQEALELAKEKGPAPILDEMFEVSAEMLRLRPEMEEDGYLVGEQVKGSVLHAQYSRYMQKIRQLDPELVAELAKTGARFTHHSSIAPTGTIALSIANNASNGIEPSFAHQYSRNIIREGKKSKQNVDVFSFELLAYRHLIDPKASTQSENPGDRLPEYFISSDDISPKNHVDIQAAAQQWIDSSISKTANVPTDYPYDEFKHIYSYAHEKGLKGCTTFRFNPEIHQGVLVKKQDLEKTMYQFVLEDGEIVTANGNEVIEYDGETHTAANLYDALKEGYYGQL